MSEGLRVIRPGIRSELQDGGRYGFASQGMSQGGPMDAHAYAWANKLLVNQFNSPVLEITVGRAEFEVKMPLRMALTGADMQASLDGKPIEPWRTFLAFPGQVLILGTAQDGMRAYLAVAGGFQVSQSQGSVSTVARNQMGGLNGDGGSLQAGDRLSCLPCEEALREGKCQSSSLSSIGNTRVPSL